MAAEAALTAELMGNRVERITDVGVRVGDSILPDIEQQPFHSLNAVVQWRVVEHLKLKFKVNNLLLSSREYRQDDFTVQSINPGMSFSLGLEYSQ